MHNHVLASHIFSRGWTFIWFTTRVLGVAVGFSNGYLPKSASEKYDLPGQPCLNTDSNQQQLLMSESEDFFFVSSPPVWCEGCADPDGTSLALKFKLTICLFLSSVADLTGGRVQGGESVYPKTVIIAQNKLGYFTGHSPAPHVVK